MADEIPLRPQIPAQLRLAANKGSLVPFVGAGLSMLAGCPDWGQFSGGALKLFTDAGKINHSQLSQIRTLSPRTQLSLAMAMAKEHRIAIDFEKLLKPDAVLKEEGVRAYASLGKIATTFVTTNYDDLLDTVSPSTDSLEPAEPSSMPVATKRNVYSKVEEFTYAALNQGNSVFHIHGSMANPSGMILTTSDYLTHYASHSIDGGSYRENPYLAFLAMLFRTKNVLFVGYSLNELEILEYVIHKARSPGAVSGIQTREEPRHFLLYGFFSHELELKRSLERYYSTECGVQLIPFSKDQKDWNQLADVLEYLAQELPAQSLLQLQKRNELRGLLE